MTFYKEFCAKHSIIDPTPSSINLRDKNYFFGLYACYLAKGSTLLCKSIKADTIRRYLDAASRVYLEESLSKVYDPRHDISGKLSPHIRSVLNEVHRWESMPEWKEPVMLEMLECIKDDLNSDKNPIAQALFDWNIIGHYYGFRLSEWAQQANNLSKTHP